MNYMHHPVPLEREEKGDSGNGNSSSSINLLKFQLKQITVPNRIQSKRVQMTFVNLFYFLFSTRVGRALQDEKVH